MAVLDVVLYPDDPLTQKAEPYGDLTPDVGQLVRDMFETMDAHDGVGLAGPQVGVARRIFVMREPEGEDICLINPEIIESDGREEGEEGCLSLPEVYTMVPRATHVRVRALNSQGESMEFEAEDLAARIIQHELDHLNGVIFLDRVDILTRQSKIIEWEEVRNRLLANADGR